MGSVDRRLYEYDLDWLLNDAPAQLGERSTAGSNVGAIERGGPPASISDTGPYHEQFIRALWAVDHARKLTAAWERLSPGSQAILRARYLQRQHWPTGAAVLLGQDLVGVALLLAPDRNVLTDACTSGAKKESLAIIRQARDLAFAAVKEAHDEWRRIRRQLARKWAEQEIAAE